MSAGRWRTAAGIALVPVLLTAGCAVKRIDNGVYHSPKGYRVTIPGPHWSAVTDGRADLELRHRSSPAAMAVNAVCDAATTRRGARILSRQLLVGLRGRKVVESGDVEIAGRTAVRAVVDARQEGSETPVRIETIVLNDDRCVYDLMYVAPPATFDDTRAEFERLADSFRTDRPDPTGTE